jgi:hypothetical protein
MGKAWRPRSWENICKCQAGRRKLHMRKREARANRIVQLLPAVSETEGLRESSYSWLPFFARHLQVSPATVQRVLGATPGVSSYSTPEIEIPETSQVVFPVFFPQTVTINGLVAGPAK